MKTGTFPKKMGDINLSKMSIMRGQPLRIKMKEKWSKVFALYMGYDIVGIGNGRDCNFLLSRYI